MTLVPVRMYFKKGLVKVAVSLAKGKKEYDKRETIKRRDTDRETLAEPRLKWTKTTKSLARQSRNRSDGKD
jgi:tmRNA-binding protein